MLPQRLVSAAALALAVAVAPADAAQELPDLEAAPAFEADDACTAGGAGCSLSALQYRGKRTTSGVPPAWTTSGKTLGLRRSPRSRQRRETNGHVADGRLEGAAWADYSVNATIGGKTFQVIVDTGSSTFAVAAAPGEGCWEYYDGPCLNKHIAAYYGSGNWTGDVCSGPEVTLAGLSAGAPLFAGIKTQDNFLVTCDKAEPGGIISEGIVGMAYPDLIEDFDGVPLFDSVVKVTGMPNVFSMQCCGWKGAAAASGQLVLGGVDKSLYTGEFQFTPITRHLWFCVDLQEVLVEGADPPPPMPEPVCPETYPAVPCFFFGCVAPGAQCVDGLCQCPQGSCFSSGTGGLWQCVNMEGPGATEPLAAPRLQQLGALKDSGGARAEELHRKQSPGQEGCNAIVDSGTSELILSKEHYYHVLHGLENYVAEGLQEADCIREENLASFPSITIILQGDVKLSVPPTTYFQPRPDGSGCFILFVGRGTSPAIIGQPLMEAYYTVFDKENDRIGFAPIAGCPGS